jgi:hypothetical protein
MWLKVIGFQAALSVKPALETLTAVLSWLILKFSKPDCPKTGLDQL